MDAYDALDRATAGFAAVIDAVRPSDWDAPSVNPGWSVLDLVNHVVGGNRRYVLLLAGRPMTEVEALRDVAHLSDDPAGDFRATSAAVVAAFHAPGVLERITHHRRGDRTGADLLVMRVMEHSLHGWDLACSIDNQPFEVDDEVAASVLAAVDADPTLLPRCGYPAYDDPTDAAPSYRLRALTGRTPTGRTPTGPGT